MIVHVLFVALVIAGHDIDDEFTCHNKGECYVLACDGDWCECQDTSDIDYDQDGIYCPEDCDNGDPSVQKRIECYPDHDQDGFGDCSQCNSYCVATGTTCPEGYIELHPSEQPPAHEFTRQNLCTNNGDDDDDSSSSSSSCDDDDDSSSSSSSSDDDDDDSSSSSSSSDDDDDSSSSSSSSDDDDDSSSSSSSSGSNDENYCDCCDSDPHAFPGSEYAFIVPNECGSYDYNCDGEVSLWACCDKGNDENGREMWNYIDECQYGGVFGDAVHCGGCSTYNAHASRWPGWGCADECPENDISHTDSCPEVCDEECVCLNEDDSMLIGECSQYITHCVEARPEIFSDGSECCVAAAN